MFDIYSDIDSKVAHYKCIGSFFLPVCILEVCCGIMVLHNILFDAEDSIYGPLADLFLFGFLLIMGSVFLLIWNSIRKKIKMLKKEKDVWV